MSFSVPIVFIVFNRPDLTKIVFEAIARVKPNKLLIVADGPRFPQEVQKCEQVRAITRRVNWDCEVLTNFSDNNLGCKIRVSSGLDWAFSQVDEAIILEDDCLPHPTFFRFCQDILSYYRNDEKVMHISGTNLNPQSQLKASYLLSRLVPIWGWATWRRAWQHFDITMAAWPEQRDTDLLDYFGEQKGYVFSSFEKLYLNKVNAWAGRWAFACVVRHGLSVIPKTNLVRNLGFREDATHTTGTHWISNLPVKGVKFPFNRPETIAPDRAFDEKYLGLQSGAIAYSPPLVWRVRHALDRRLRALIKGIS